MAVDCPVPSSPPRAGTPLTASPLYLPPFLSVAEPVPASRRVYVSPPVTLAGSVFIDVELPCLPWQLDFLGDTRTSILAAVGGIGSGKTFGLMAYAVMKMQREAGRGTLGGIFANTYQQLQQSVLPKLWAMFDLIGFEYGSDFVFNEAPPRAWRGFASKFKKSHTNVLSVRRWGQAVARSLDNYNNLRGIELGWFTMDEARDTKLDAFRVVLGRFRCPLCSHREGRLTTSPNGYDWIYDEFVDKPVARSGSRRLIQMTTRDNAFMPEEAVREMESSFDPRYAEQELGGKFVSLRQGSVYHCFNRNVHVRPGLAAYRPSGAISVPVSWQVCWDFNRTPFTVSLCQTLGDREANPAGCEVRVLDVVEMHDADTRSVARECLSRLVALGFRPGADLLEVWGDPAGNSKDTRSHQTDYDLIRVEFNARLGGAWRARWKTSHPEVLARVNAVNALLRSSDGRVRCFLSDRAAPLRRDFERVCYIVGSSEIDKSDKTLTHASDGFGYYVAECFPAANIVRSGRVRFQV